jgi:hypothetical protein
MAEEATPSLVPTTSEEKTSSEEMAPSWKGSKRRSLGPMAFEELSEEISQDGDKTVETEESVRSTATLTLREVRSKDRNGWSEATGSIVHLGP